MEENNMSETQEKQENNQSELHEPKIIKRYITLKSFLLEPAETLKEEQERTKEPRCFLCNGHFLPDLKTGENKATAIELESYNTINGKVQEYVLFHGNCFDIAAGLFSAFFKEFIYAYLFDGSLRVFEKEDYESPFPIIDIEE